MEEENQTKKISDRDKSFVWEIIRFVIVGVYGTLVDLFAEGWFTSLVSSKTADATPIVAFLAMFAISIIGFLISTPATWSLTSVWGFRNVEKESEKKAKSVKGLLIFVAWAFLGLFIGAFIQLLGYMICLEWSGWGINILGGFNFEQMFGEDGNINVFFAWFIVFVIRTCFTMVFNFITRKLFIYKAPKEEEKKE